MEITPLGDSALLIRVAQNLEDAPEETLNRVLATKRALEAAKIPGIVELAPAYTTVAIFYDPAGALNAGAPAENIFRWIEERIRGVLAEGNETQTDRIETRIVEVPVCYENEFAPDLEDVARRVGIHWKEVVDLYCGAEYRVHCVGF